MPRASSDWEMKTLLLSTAAALVAASTFAQNTPQPVPRSVVPAAVSAGGGDLAEEAARFDLKFPGGKVKEFVAAVSKALGKPVNVVIPKEGEDTLIPAVEVSRVTVPALFNALSNASQHEGAFPTSVTSGLGSGSGRVTNTSVQYKIVGFTFRTEEKSSPDAVWTFHVTNPPNIPATTTQPKKKTLIEVPVAPRLSPQISPAARKPL